MERRYAECMPHPSPPSGWQATDPHRPGYTPSEFDSAKNTPATAGLALGIISPFVGPHVGIAGLVLSGIGLSRSNTYSRAGHSPTGHKKAIWGLILSSLGTTLSIGLLILLLGH